MSISPTSSSSSGEIPHHQRSPLYTIFIPSSLSPSPPAGSVTTPEQSPQVVTFLQEQGHEKINRTGRKGHKKSRGACYTCKRQKIKCKENRPSCDYCSHRAIKCEWPTITTKPRTKKPAPSINTQPQQAFQPLEPILSIPPRSIQLHDAPPVFTMEYMRLFNHFIQRAYPHHPSGNDSIWTHEIPSLASEYDYLIHSMLALSASELSVSDTNPNSNTQRLRNTSLYHRSKSITALNSAIQRGVNSVEEGNAMLAAIFSLLFQSTFISDGLVEYMTFIRGGIVVGGQMVKKHLKIVFSNLNVAQPPAKEGDPEKESEGIINDAPSIQEEVVLGAVKSLEICAQLCSTKLERRVHASLVETANSLVVSSSHAYLKLREMYGLFAMQMTDTEFQTFTSPTSPSVQTFKILQAHFVALQLIMNPVAAMEAMPRATCPVKEIGRSATVGWLVSLHRDVENVLLRKYCVWTRWVEEEVLGGRLLDGSRARRICVFEDDVGGVEIVANSGIVGGAGGGGGGGVLELSTAGGGCPFRDGSGGGKGVQRLGNIGGNIGVNIGGNMGICTG